MKKTIIFVTALFFAGCGPSNWNVFSRDLGTIQAPSNHPVQSTQTAQTKPVQAPVQSSVPSVEDDFEVVEEDLSKINTKSTQIKENAENSINEKVENVQEKAQSVKETAQEKVETVKEKVSETKQTATSQYHINKIIEIWGEPNSVSTNANGNKVYSWKNCKSVGGKTSCCDRKLRTNDAGYVQNLKEAIATCK